MLATPTYVQHHDAFARPYNRHLVSVMQDDRMQIEEDEMPETESQDSQDSASRYSRNYQKMKEDERWNPAPHRTAVPHSPFHWEHPATPSHCAYNEPGMHYEDHAPATQKSDEDILLWTADVHRALLEEHERRAKQAARARRTACHRRPELAPPVLYYGYPVTAAQSLAIRSWLDASVGNHKLSIRRIQRPDGASADAIVFYSNYDGFLSDEEEWRAISVLRKELRFEDLPAWHPVASGGLAPPGMP
ncbi:hypothetical protein BV25DRAFT_1919246 [Artomyces pyxidatus]|uniref:Uncharacterized protein n=1 Tax=Artomyces pyxidatus TaxID=48021 RepID=A0ACB8SPX1_9AGAM|nr:hypothetical protein BV25DRAFT_1919246 [Artomyces pyxidatus]